MTNIDPLSTALLLVILISAIRCLMIIRNAQANHRLAFLTEEEPAADEDVQTIAREAGALAFHSDRLGRAGYTDALRRRTVKHWGIAAIGAVAFGSSATAFLTGATPLVILAAFVSGGYLAVTVIAFLLSYRERDYEREVLFQTPLFLESLILLVESGLGILPALHRLATAGDKNVSSSPVRDLFRIVYQLSANGMTLSQALETVAEASPHRIIRHTMLHLDITGAEGGELVPSLRALSDHAHSEWKLSVEQRVRRLENLVVFPVCASVLGLMLLTAAVPIAPLLNFAETLGQHRIAERTAGILVPRK